MNLITIVHKLRKAKGTNAKLDILKQHKNNELWIKFLKYTYDERMSFGVSAPNTYDFDTVKIDNHMFDEFDCLAKRKDGYTGNKAKTVVKLLSSVYGEISRLVLARSVKAGISAKTINKAYPNLIEIFESLKGKDVPIIQWPVESSIKYDGVKVFTEVRESGITLRTSSGLPFILKSLITEFESAAYGVYEGELIYKEGKIIHRPKINGMLVSLLAGTKDDITDYSYMIYDCMSLNEWDSQVGTLSFKERQSLLDSQFKLGFQDSFFVKRVEHLTLLNIKEVEEFFEYLISLGYEGSMHRYAEDLYEWKRIDRLIKKKSIKECVLLCKSVVPHSNPSKGLIGSLICEGEINDKHVGKVFVNVKVGSGLSKMDIQYSEERYVGEYIETLYNSVTTNDDGSHSLFLPRYKRISTKDVGVSY